MKYTLHVPGDLMRALEDERARTFNEHRLQTAAWLRRIWIGYLSTHAPAPAESKK